MILRPFLSSKRAILSKSVAGMYCLFFVYALLGQTTNYVVDQFDTDTTGLYINQHWGAAIPTISWDGTTNATTTLGPNNPGSGSAKWIVPWTTTGDQIEVTRAFNSGTVLNLGNFSSVSFDIMFASNSATDGKGSSGAVEVDAIPQSVGWPNTALAIYTSAVTNGNGWIHVSLPVNAAGNANLNAVTGIGFKIQQSETGANLSGATTFWLDNIIFSGYTVPPVTGSPQIIQLNAAQLWQMLQFQITNVPTGGNPFDPAIIRLDATFTLPSGGTMVVPAFWYQGYTLGLSGGTEQDTVSGPPQWRLRFTPPEAGNYSLSLVIETNDQPYATVVTNFTVISNTPPARFGYVSTAPDNQYFRTGDGLALPLNGENVAWDNNGTYDYDTWFASMKQAGENFARVWMSPWCFGIEGNPGTLTNYALDPAWQLDYVLQLAATNGIYVQLTLDDYREYSSASGSDGQWVNNPYNNANGGPCVNQNAFFTNTTAQVLYKKRLRYLIARYGYSQNLLAWEFFNEIDHDYSYLDSSDVDTWVAEMGAWLHTNDPYHHLVTTSLSYASADPQLWAVPELDFLSWHTYFSSGYQLNPALTMANDAAYYRQTYHKPVQIGEYGTDWHSWSASMTVDPYLRGLREGIWGGALGGSVGTAMTWWWDSLAPANDYWLYSSLGVILGRTDWGRGDWTNIVFQDGQPLTAVGQRGAHDSLVYVVASDAAWPTGGTNATLPVQQGQILILTNWPAGVYYAEWYNPTNGLLVGSSQATTANGGLTLPLPDYSVDLAGIIHPSPTLMLPKLDASGTFQFQLNSEAGGVYSIEKSTDLSNWVPFLNVTNVQGTMNLLDAKPTTNSATFYRARQI
jgi:Domain of unknown function (DUF5060)